MHDRMTAARPAFDDALAFFRELLRARGLPGRLTWVFSEDVSAQADGSAPRPRSAGAGEWLARRAYAAAPSGETLVFTACASSDGHTIAGLAGDLHDRGDEVRRDDWNLLFDTACRLQHAFSTVHPKDAAGPHHLLALAPVREQMTANELIALRREALRDLVLFVSPLASVWHSLTDVAQTTEEQSMLEQQHLLSVLTRFEAGEIAAEDVEAWANAIERCRDVGYDRETAVWDVLYELANPSLTERLTRERADVLASVLKGH